MSNTPNQEFHDSPHDAPRASAHEPDTLAVAPIIVDEQGKPYPETEDSKRRRKQDQGNLLDRVKHGERWMIALTAILALTTIAQAWMNYLNNKSNGAQIDKVIVAADRIDDAADAFSLSSANISRSMSDAVTKLDNQAKTLENARKTSEANSKQALDATIENFHEEQRAWLSIQPAVGAPESDSPFKIIIPLGNNGRTPAKHLVIYFTGRFSSAGEKPTYTFSGKPIPLGIANPGTFSTNFTYNSATRIGMNTYVAQQKGKQFTVYGAVTYEDVFSVKHWNTFCFFGTDGDSYAYCEEHNEFGDGPLAPDQLK